MVEALRRDILPVLIEVAAGAVAQQKRRETVACRRARAGRIGSLRERSGEPEGPRGARFPHVDAQHAPFITGLERVFAHDPAEAAGEPVVVESALAMVVSAKRGLGA